MWSMMQTMLQGLAKRQLTNYLMNKYKVQANGRQSGAIGITHIFEDEVEVSDKTDIRLALYEGRTKSGKAWECITQLKYKQL